MLNTPSQLGQAILCCSLLGITLERGKKILAYEKKQYGLNRGMDSFGM
jgi:hypothetical protein